ncbi:MAG: DUF4268 domain-containing protein [Phototrophicaceae bacterium]|nr:MAG: DUF4268 domain-containing protein [Chloroflexota bacterium]
MTSRPLGTLQRVALREVWSSESTDFTPWLAQDENLKLLGDTLGLDLALEATEQQVGPFRADIVAKDTTDGSFVLIENQLERTDHSHLGQLLTYAAGLSTVTIVWIAERFTDEHRAALDWLNEVTSQDIGFFGLEIELWRIGDSPAAPKFNIVSQPNEWVKTVSKARSDGSLSEGDQLRLEFWTEFHDYLQNSNSFVKSQKPSTAHWTSYSIGRSGFHISALAGMTGGFISVELVLEPPQAKGFFRALSKEKSAIEGAIGTSLDWRELPDKKMSIISIRKNGIDPTDRSHWPQYFVWLKQYVEAFDKTFRPRIKTLTPLPPPEDESDA